MYTSQKFGGIDHTSSFTCPEGSKYEVEVITNNDYIAGTPITKSGTINRDITIKFKDE